MLAAVDGRIEAGALRAVIPGNDYEATGALLGGDGWVCGRTTMQLHFAEDEPFVPASPAPAGPQPVHVARRAGSYAISVDTLGRLRWTGGDLDGDHLVCVVSERATADYLAYLRDRGISYVVAGGTSVDLAAALERLAEDFGIRTLLLEGGGHINGAFLEAGLVDELSLLLAPGIDGRRGVPTVFDGIDDPDRAAVPLRLRSVERREHDTIWLRYDVLRDGAARGEP
jgi:riboflavin biosynthesis pyrimidine reductase